MDLPAALGRVLAEPVGARLTLPPWDNSAMDGFAVRAADVAGASPASPVSLPVAGDVAAGAAPDGCARSRARHSASSPARRCRRGADAVVPVEDTDAPRGTAGGGMPPERVTISAAPTAGAHIRSAGSDILAGARLLEPGRRLNAVGPGARGGWWTRRSCRCSAGRGWPFSPPVTSWSRAGAALGPGQIHGQQLDRPDGPGIAVGAPKRVAGHGARRPGRGRRRRLREAMDWADVVVVSGGVSVGAHDVVKTAFERFGKLDAVAGSESSPASRSPSDGPLARGRCSSSGCPATRSAASSPSSFSCGPC